MRFLGNIIWFICGGAVTALIWLFGSLIFALSVVGLPISRAAFEIAKMSAFPFGKEIIHVREVDGKGLTPITATTGTIGLIANLVWALTVGWVLFVIHILAGLIACVTIIGIPFGIQSFKLAAISLWPVGRRVVSKEFAFAARVQNAQEKIQKKRGRTVSV